MLASSLPNLVVCASFSKRFCAGSIPIDTSLDERSTGHYCLGRWCRQRVLNWFNINCRAHNGIKSA